jgi:hypothetical protein
MMTALDTSSGASKSFAIVGDAKRITISFSSVQINAAGGGKLNIQLSSGGAYKTSGYLSSVALAGASQAGVGLSSGFVLTHAGFDNNVHSGVATLVNITGNKWVCSAVLGLDGDTYAYMSGGSVTLDGPVDGVRLVSSNGADAFDGGTLGCIYETAGPSPQPNITSGYTASVYDAGTKSSGTFTPDPTIRNFQKAVNGGAHTLAPPSTGAGDSMSMVLQYTNNGSAGAITTSGFSKVDGSFTTTNGDDFMCFVTVVGAFSHLNIVAMQ